MKIPFKKEFFLPNIWIAVRRFPITLIFCLASVSLWIYMVEKENFESMAKLFYTFFLGMVLFVPITQFFESRGWQKKMVLGYLFGTILLGAYYLSIDLEQTTQEAIRFSFYLFSAVVAIPVGFLIKKPSEDNLWLHFVLTLKNLIQSAFLSGIMYAGVAIAISTIHSLFDIKFDEKIYLYTWFVFAGFYAPLLFLSKFHEPNAVFENTKKYELENFLIRFVITPLSLFYLGILYVYFAKLIFSQELPKGTLAYLIMSFCSLATFTHFVTFAYKEQKFYKYINKLLYFFIVPLIFLLAYSLYLRISEYGVTENRYVISVVGMWLAFISVYMILTKFKKFKMIFYSLCVVPLVISIGPWSAFSISEKSQIGRLISQMEKGELLKDGVVEKNPSNINELKEIKEIIRYLEKRGLLEKLEAYAFFDKPVTRKSLWFQLGLSDLRNGEFVTYFSLRFEEPHIFPINKYQYHLPVNFSRNRDEQKFKNIKLGDDFKSHYEGNAILLVKDSITVFELDLTSTAAKYFNLAEKNSHHFNLTFEQAVIPFDQGEFIINNLAGKHEAFGIGLEQFTINFFNLDIYFNLPEE